MCVSSSVSVCARNLPSGNAVQDNYLIRRTVETDGPIDVVTTGDDVHLTWPDATILATPHAPKHECAGTLRFRIISFF